MLLLYCLSAVLGLVAHPLVSDSIRTSEPYALDTVRVVASPSSRMVRTAAPFQQVGQSFRQFGVLTMGDALKHFAGVTLRDYGGAGGMKTVSVRGNGVRHTAVVYDGIALTDAQTGELDVARYSLNSIASVSLSAGDDDHIFAPARNQSQAATLWLDQWSGMEAILQNRKAVRTVGMQAGSWGQVQPYLHLAGTLSRHLATSLAGDFFHADNGYPFRLRNGAYKTREHRHNSQMNSGRLETNILWQPTPQRSLRGKVYLYQNNRHLPGIVHYYTADNAETLHESNAFTQWNYRERLSPKWQYMLNAKLNYAKSDYCNGTPSGGIGDACYWQREVYASGSIGFQPLQCLELAYSGDFSWNDLRSTLGFFRNPTRRTAMQSLAGKWQTGRLKVIARILIAFYNDHQADASKTYSDRQFSPSLSLSYRLLPTEELYLRLMAKDVGRMPNFNELYFFHIGTTELRPERCRQVNIGLTFTRRFGQSLQLDATLDAYQNWVNDKIVAIPFNMYVWRMTNAQRVRSRGVDIVGRAEWDFLPGQQLFFTANYSYLRAENRSQPASPNYRNQIPYTPEHTLCMALAWHRCHWTAGLTYNFLSERWTTMEHSDGTRMGSYGQLDAAVTYGSQWKNRPYALQLDCLNLLNRQYELVAHYPMPGRQWRISMKIDF